MGPFLEDKVILITGGTRGIGKAIAIRLAAERPKSLVLSYCMNHEAARQTKAEIERLGIEVKTYALDLGEEGQIAGMFSYVNDLHGRLDVLVSNAARTAFRPVCELKARAWQRIVAMNASAFLFCAQHASALMRKNGGGIIIAISSLGAAVAPDHYAGLGAVKASIESLVRYFAVECAPLGINVNAVRAGYIESELARLIPNYPAIAQQIVKHTPAGRLGVADDVAGATALLCSPDSRWIRGQTIVADGGFSLVPLPGV
jgi:enoyl-[acyl-carrier protein] reductase III